jgi:ribose 5-phosphate isomerase B
MRIAIGADHAGFELKEHLKRMLAAGGYEVDDLGTHDTVSTDYPDYAAAVAHESCRVKPIAASWSA